MAMPAGYNLIYGEGWHDGTPEGLAAFNAYNASKSAQPPSAQQQLATGGPNASGAGYRTAFTGIPNQNVLNMLGNPLANPLAQMSGGAVPPVMTNASSTGLLGGICDNLTGWKKLVCQAGGMIGDAILPGDPLLGGGGSSSSGGQVGGGITSQATGCPPGYHAEAGKGCVINGVGSYIPGDVGRPDVIWSPINGRYGAGLTPVQVAQPKLACPPGYVLGKDNVCYDRIARTNRKWNPGVKPLLTGGDMNAIRRTKRVEKRWRKVAGAFHKKVVPAGARLVKQPRRK